MDVKSDPTAPVQSATKCIYFPDKAAIIALEEVLKNYPRASLSAIIAQIVEPLADTIKKMPSGQRQVDLNVRIWI